MKSFRQFINEIEDTEGTTEKPKSLVGTPQQQANKAREASLEKRNKAKERANMKHEIKRELQGF